MLRLAFLLSIYFVITQPTISFGEVLNEYILHYETLDYDPNRILKEPSRSRRADGTDKEVHLTFHSYGKVFNLELKRDVHTFSNSLEIVSHNNEPLQVDTSHIYEGNLRDEPESRAYGSIIDGIFDGQIHTADGIFYVERASKYQSLLKNANHTAHSIIYKDEDVVDSYKDHPTGVRGFNFEGEITITDDEGGVHRKKKRGITNASLPFYKVIQSSMANRAGAKLQTCPVFIHTDPLLWKHFHRQNVENTRKEITSMIAQHVEAVNVIFHLTRVKGLNRYRLQVKRIQIDDYEACRPNLTREENKFCRSDIDIQNTLDLHSQANHDGFCLAYLFTYRDFAGRLGLAWEASPLPDFKGGICDKYSPNNAGLTKSMNTGIVSFANSNRRVTPKISQLTFAHEVGHNFGAPHDPSHCIPKSHIKGNYLMFALAIDGRKPNNMKFSDCSIDSIAPVLYAIKSGRKKNCFLDVKNRYTSFCGNNIIDPGEECDCGYDYNDCKEKCCYPAEVAEESRNSSARGCTLRPGAKCSPSQGLCCTESCNFVKLLPPHVCKEEEECSEKSICNGYSPVCPRPFKKRDGMKCNGNTQRCLKGQCSGSICSEIGMEPCFISSRVSRDRKKLCELACRTNTSETCLGTSKLQTKTNLSAGIILRPGSPCDNYNGYCDVFFRCRNVNEDGPIVRLKNRFFNSLSAARRMKKLWWAVLLTTAGLILITGTMVKCCAVYTPSSNPEKSKALSFRQSLRHPIRTWQQFRHRLRRKITSMTPFRPPLALQWEPPPINYSKDEKPDEKFKRSRHHSLITLGKESGQRQTKVRQQTV